MYSGEGSNLNLLTTSPTASHDRLLTPQISMDTRNKPSLCCSYFLQAHHFLGYQNKKDTLSSSENIEKGGWETTCNSLFLGNVMLIPCHKRFTKGRVDNQPSWEYVEKLEVKKKLGLTTTVGSVDNQYVPPYVLIISDFSHVSREPQRGFHALHSVFKLTAVLINKRFGLLTVATV